MTRLACLFLLLSSFSGCLVSPAGESSRFTLEVSFEAVPAIVRQSPDSWFVQVTLEGGDLERPLEATARGLAGSDADLTLSTTSGGPRRLTVTYFFYTGEVVETWTHARSDLYLVPGDQTVEVPLRRAPEFTLEGRLQGAGQPPQSVQLQELSTGLFFPPVQPVEGEGDTVTFTMPHIPVGRFFLLQVRDADGELVSFDDCPVFSSRPGTLSFEGDLEGPACAAE